MFPLLRDPGSLLCRLPRVERRHRRSINRSTTIGQEPTEHRRATSAERGKITGNGTVAIEPGASLWRRLHRTKVKETTMKRRLNLKTKRSRLTKVCLWIFIVCNLRADYFIINCTWLEFSYRVTWKMFLNKVVGYH